MIFTYDLFRICFRKSRRKKAIVKKHELFGVQQCIKFLKEHCNYRGLFVTFGSRSVVQRIVAKIRYGDENIFEFLKSQSSPRECATALNQFLRSIGKPLLSRRVQQLILADNYGVCPRVIALDALSLLSEDLEGSHRELFILVMDMMKTLSTIGSLRPSELRVSHAPYLLIPLLFSLSDKISKNWKNMADILNEMIICFNFFLQDGHFKPDPTASIYTVTQPSPATANRSPPKPAYNLKGRKWVYEPLIRRIANVRLRDTPSAYAPYYSTLYNTVL